MQTRIELQKQHQALGSTFIYVTHDQVEAMTMGDRIAVMKDGLLHQVGTPDEIYDHPANLFVAGFIGSPTMNFVAIQISGRQARASGFEFELPRTPGVDKGLLGIRPEAITDRPKEGAPIFDMQVEVVERLGSDEYLYGQVGGDTITARVDPKLRVKVGTRIKLSLDVDQLPPLRRRDGKGALVVTP